VIHRGQLSDPTLSTGRRCAEPVRNRLQRRQARPTSASGARYAPSVEDYTSKYKGEQVEVALFGGEYQEGVLTAYCFVDEVAHIELNGHILVPLQNIASLHCSSRCDAPQNEDWPPRGLLEDDGQEDGGDER
jgi:hypothetical protein